MSLTVTETCRAKLNLFLDVRGRLADGYHELVTVFHEIDLADELEVARDEQPGVTLTVDGDDDLPTGDGNLAVRAARVLLDESGVENGVRLRLTKRIPVGAGLGGGSADAAGALRGVDRLLDLRTPEADLLRIAASLGSDVPFCLRGATAIGRGRGELLEPLAVPAGMRFLVLHPAFGISTAAVYGALPDPLVDPVAHEPLCAALASGDARALGAATYNALVPAAVHAEPRLGDVLVAMRERYGADVQMTGSGSTLFRPLAVHDQPDVSRAGDVVARVVSSA